MTSQHLYDWNARGSEQLRRVGIVDDTLRDGLQSPSAKVPTIEEKKLLLRLAARIGVDGCILGFPGSGKDDLDAIAQLVDFSSAARLGLEPITAVRTHMNDIDAHMQLCNRTGVCVTAAIFVGCSPIRTLIEDWDASRILANIEKCVTVCTSQDIPVLFVTEDTTRSHPDMVRDVYMAAMHAGATRICVADTVGHAEPSGVEQLFAFLNDIVDKSGTKTAIDWHGHNDRGLSLINAITAVECGASRVHATCLGFGERCGNTAIEQFIMHAALKGAAEDRFDVSVLMEYCEAVHRLCNAPMPANLPVVGGDAYRTSSGIHASAIIKALERGETDLADRVYSSVPASMLNRKQNIEIGPMSGISNVRFWINRNYPSLPDATKTDWEEHILKSAKRKNTVYSDGELHELIKHGEY